MVETAVDQPVKTGKPRKGRTLVCEALSSVFGVDIDMDGVSTGDVAPQSKRGRTPARTRKTVKKVEKRSTAVRKTKSRAKPGKKTTSTKTELQREPTFLEDIFFSQTAGVALLFGSLSIFFPGPVAIHQNIKMHKRTGVPLYFPRHVSDR
jgi:hypothetical protein